MCTSAVDLSILGYPLLSFFRLCRNDISILNICSWKGSCLVIFVRQREFDGSSLQIRKYFVIFRPSKQTGNVSRILLFVIGIPVLLLCHATALLLLLLLLLLSLLLFLRSTHVLHINRGERLKRKKGGMFTAL